MGCIMYFEEGMYQRSGVVGGQVFGNVDIALVYIHCGAHA